MSCDKIYINWVNTCKNIVENKIENWKKLPDVINMLEHLSPEHGKIYLESLINDDFDISLIQHLGQINDRNGSSIEDYGIIKISPTTIRYIRHAFEICNLVKEKGYNKINFIEVGAGYAGLCLILNNYAKHIGVEIKNYYILDLNEVGNLQKFYLQNQLINVSWKNCNLYGNDIPIDSTPTILISAYCLSEVSNEIRQKYLETLLPKVQGGYMLWNNTSVEGLPTNIKMKLETPQTGTYNTLITF